VNYKTIVVQVDPAAAAAARIRLALGLARRFGAHLVGCAPTGVSHFVTPAMLAAGDSRLAERCAALRRAAALALQDFTRLAREEGVDASEARLVDDDADGGMALQARYCDLVVVGQADPGASTPAGDDLADYLLLTSGRPILVVPCVGGPWRLDGEALVAWDGSVEATRAVTAALPLLRAARGTTVVGFGTAPFPADGGDPCARLADWLGRQGVSARTGHRAASGDVGAALLTAAADLDAGLLVMGGYGHARYRELLLGGVTAAILRDMTLPVLLAH